MSREIPSGPPRWCARRSTSGGRPLADLENEPFAASVTRDLDEAWVEALETRIEADLALGRHAELAPELVALVRRHPLRERLRAQLMLALYRSGRQAEALEAFDDGRRKLGEELGLEPGTPAPAASSTSSRRTPGSSSCVPPAPAPAPLAVSTWLAGAACRAGDRRADTIPATTRNPPPPARAGGPPPGRRTWCRDLERRVSVGSTPGAISVGEGAIWGRRRRPDGLPRRPRFA